MQPDCNDVEGSILGGHLAVTYGHRADVGWQPLAEGDLARDPSVVTVALELVADTVRSYSMLNKNLRDPSMSTLCFSNSDSTTKMSQQLEM